MSSITTVRPPLPPFTLETAIEKVRLAEDGWNTRDAVKVALAYSLDTKWRNRAEFANDRAEAQSFLVEAWSGSWGFTRCPSWQSGAPSIGLHSRILEVEARAPRSGTPITDNINTCEIRIDVFSLR